jgi:hypothetical protein
MLDSQEFGDSRFHWILLFSGFSLTGKRPVAAGWRAVSFKTKVEQFTGRLSQIWNYFAISTALFSKTKGKGLKSSEIADIKYRCRTISHGGPCFQSMVNLLVPASSGH